MGLYAQIFTFALIVVILSIISIQLGLVYYCFYNCNKLISKCCKKKETTCKVQPYIDDKVNELYMNPLTVQEYIVC